MIARKKLLNHKFPEYAFCELEKFLKDSLLEEVVLLDPSFVSKGQV
jgi:hypothetical protein